MPFEFLKAPHAAILSEKVLCDRNGLDAEIRGYKTLGWTTNWVFKRLSEPRVAILEEIDLASELRNDSALQQLDAPHSRQFIAKQRMSRAQPIKYFDQYDFAVAFDISSKLEMASEDVVLPFGWTSGTPSQRLAIQKQELFAEMVLPGVRLIPPWNLMPKDLFALFQEVQKAERELWIKLEECEWSVEEYQRERAAMPLAKYDHLFDEWLFEVGVEQRLRALIELRKTYKNTRKYLSRSIVEFYDGTISVRTFQKELESTLSKEQRDIEIKLLPQEERLDILLYILEFKAALLAILSLVKPPDTIQSIRDLTFLVPEAAWALDAYYEIRQTQRKNPLAYLKHVGQKLFPIADSSG